MHKIYLEKRSIIICGEDDQVLTDPNAIRFSIGQDCDLKKMIELFEISDTLQRIYIPTDDIEGAYKRVCREFLEVNAGGGLVENRRGDFLLMGYGTFPKVIKTQVKTSRQQLFAKYRKRQALKSWNLTS